MTQAMLTSNAPSMCNVARIRTNATYVLTQSMAESRGNLTFRNARAHIRISALGLVRERADAEVAS